MFASTTIRICTRAVVFGLLLAACCVLLSPTSRALAATWIWPVDGDVLTPFRNGSDRYAAGQHRGLDISAAVGTPARSVAAGRVTFAGRLPDSGNCVTVASGERLVSYLHLQSVAVRRGEDVRASTVLGATGTSGKRSVVAPHLHLSVRLAPDGEYVDPLPLLGPRPVSKPPAAQNAPAATPQSVRPPASQRATGRSEGDARVQTDARSRANADGHDRASSRSGERRSTHTSRPERLAADRVHAPPPGDTVAAAPASAAASSAREGRASRGRAAPPPASSKRTPHRLTAEAASDDDTLATSPAAAERPAHADRRAGLSWKLIAVLVACLALVATSLRRRRSSGPDRNPFPGEGPVIDRAAAQRVMSTRPAESAVDRREPPPGDSDHRLRLVGR